MDDVDPALAEHWKRKRAEKHPSPSSNGGAAQLPLTRHPAIRQQAIARFVHDEADAQIAALRVKRTPMPWDLRAIGWTGRLLFKLYAYPRSFLIVHAGFVSAQKREFRFTACQPCTLCKDGGHGLLFCAPMLAKCGCPSWLLSCLWWVTWQRKTKCPLGRWDKPEAAADEDACQQKEPPVGGCRG